MLLERDGQVVTREEIQKRLWPNDTVVEFEHSINAAIAKLRKAFGDSATEPRYIETIAKRGYRLIASAEWLSDSGMTLVGSFPTLSPKPGEKEPALSLPKGGAPAPGHPNGGSDAAAVQMQLEPPGLTGRTVSHYRVLDIIGGGGMGVVYRAEDLKLGRPVALKFLPEELGSDPQALERFSREARTASSLNHPNICYIHEFGEHEGQPFIAMELLEGETLRDRLAADEPPKPLLLQELLDIGIQVSEGLQAAHEKGIIHRDIKPANIFLTSKGAVKILDFGLAKLVEAPGAQVEVPNSDLKGHDFSRADAAAPFESRMLPPRPGREHAPSENTDDRHGTPEVVPFQNHIVVDPALTRTGVAMVTAGYMSPEQVRGEKLDARTDIFSFGLVLYEMATGQRAFGGETAVAVHDAILNQTPLPASERNSAIPPKLEAIVNRAIEKDREQRYQTAGEMRRDLQSVAERPIESESGKAGRGSRRKWPTAATALIAVAAIAGGLYWRAHRPPKLTDKDTIVLTDFVNHTGDPVFDDSLKQALSDQLAQSPFLNILSNRRVRAALKEINRPASEPLIEDVAQEVCRHTGSRAILTGVIRQLEKGYQLELKAVDCDTRQILAEAQEPAPDKGVVLRALDEAAIAVRKQMGEPLTSVQKYATPLPEATAVSLEAWKSYGMGNRASFEKGSTASLPFYKRAVEIDPNFASAYIALCFAYANRGELQPSEEYGRKAYELRDRVNERERLRIESTYYFRLTGQLDKAAETYERWQQSYPKDVMPRGNLDVIYSMLGKVEKALDGDRELVRLQPNIGIAYENLADDYLSLNRLDEAAAALKQAEDRKLMSDDMLVRRYQLAFLQVDTAQMGELAAAAKGKPGIEHSMLSSKADTEAWYGRFKAARKLVQEAMDSAQHNDAKETAAEYEAGAALYEAAAGNPQQARTTAVAALKLAQNRIVKARAALALAQAGEVAAAEKLAGEIDKERPLGTGAQQYWLPMIRAAVALERKDANRALGLLSRVGTLELSPSDLPLFTAYLRGQAHLMLGDGKAAEGEFRKFVDHYGLVRNFPWGALARLGLARAYALEADTDPAARENARTAYQNFLTLWKDADPDIPIYKQAKAEYAKLR